MIRVYVIAADEFDARLRFARAVMYSAGLAEIGVEAPELFCDEDEAKTTLAESLKQLNNGDDVSRKYDHLDEAFCAFIRAAKVFTVEVPVMDILVGGGV